MTPRTLRLSDGTAVRVLEAGVRGPALLLLHGVGLRAEAWGPQIDGLSTGCRVIAADLPGHGDSDPLPGDPRLPDYVAWAARVIGALGAGPVAVAGHSMGALIAAGLAVEHPDLVTRAALLSAVHRRDDAAKAAVLARAAEIAAGTGAVEAPLARWFDDTQTALRETVGGWLRGVSPGGYAAAYRAFAEGDAVYADRLSEIRCPLLVLTGGLDTNSTPEMTQALAALAPLGRAVVLPGHRHMVGLTAPEAVTAELRAFALALAPPDPRALRDAFGCFMTGVTVVTTLSEKGKPLGFTANSFSSVSLDPPLLLVSISNRSASLQVFLSAPGFAVNILAEGQKQTSTTFARPSDDRFAGIDWRPGPVGSPVLAEVSAWFDCTLERAIPAGDHTILLGRVGAFQATGHPGLGYYRGGYVTPAATASQMPAGPDVMLSAIIEAEGKVLLVDGGTSVPMARVGRDGVQAALSGLFAGLGVEAEAGSVYAVYEDARDGTQHLALRCPARPGRPARGAYTDLSAQGVAGVTDPALRSMLQRLAEESRMGIFGTYFGTHEQGRVQRIPEGRT